MGPVLREWERWCRAPWSPGLSLWMWDDAGNPTSFQIIVEGTAEATCLFPALMRIIAGVGLVVAIMSFVYPKALPLGMMFLWLTLIWILPSQRTKVGMWLTFGWSDYFTPPPTSNYLEISIFTSPAEASILLLLPAFAECLSSARNYSKSFRCIILFHPPINSIR